MCGGGPVFYRKRTPTKQCHNFISYFTVSTRNEFLFLYWREGNFKYTKNILACVFLFKILIKIVILN